MLCFYYLFPIENSTDKGFYLLVKYTPFRLRRNIAARLAPFIAIFLLGYIRKVCALRNQSQKAVILTTLLRLCRYGANPTSCLTLSTPRKRRYFVEAVKSVIRLKIVPTNGYICLANIYRFVWSVWSEPDILPYAFDTSEAWVFCRGERTRARRVVQSCDFEEGSRTVYINFIHLKTVPTNGFIRLPNIHRFVWSVWSEPDVLPYAFDTSKALVFCRGERA